MENSSVAEKVRVLEKIFRKLVASAMVKEGEPQQLTEEDIGDLEEAARNRGLWLEVKGLEDAEPGYRQQAAEAARRHGVVTARLVMAGLEDGEPSTFILTIPAISEVEESQIAAGLQKAIQTMLGGVLMEHEMLKSTMAATIMAAGVGIPKMTGDELEVVCEAMRSLDFETLAKALGLDRMAGGGNPGSPPA